jgi:hypothetical protein
MIIRDCLGRERPVDKTWPDGSYNCPFCNYAAKVDPVTFAGGCPNPACFARVDANGALDFPPDVARKRLADLEKASAEEKSRASIAQFQRDYANKRAEEAFAARKAATEECERRGACVRCLFQRADGRPQFIRHRKPCPNAPRARPPA